MHPSQRPTPFPSDPASRDPASRDAFSHDQRRNVSRAPDLHSGTPHLHNSLEGELPASGPALIPAETPKETFGRIAARLGRAIDRAIDGFGALAGRALAVLTAARADTVRLPENLSRASLENAGAALRIISAGFHVVDVGDVKIFVNRIPKEVLSPSPDRAPSSSATDGAT
jgi:hypothetical protein